MALYKVDKSEIMPLQRTTFAQQDLKERTDIQQMLKNNIDVISPGTLVVAEEFCEWEDSRLRIDLLGIDKEASLVVIELKRTEDGGYMELQSLRYASMISTLTFEKLVPIYENYLQTNGIQKDAVTSLLEFLGWTSPEDGHFAGQVRIVLASAHFSKELTTSVMWLNDFGLDIRCVKMNPYIHNSETLLDVQTIIPLPEAAEYQIRIREKKQKEREALTRSRDFTKYDLCVSGEWFRALNKRRMMFYVVSEVQKIKQDMEEILKLFPLRKYLVFEGLKNADEVQDLVMSRDGGGALPLVKRYFIEQDELFYSNGRTYVLSNQWSGHHALPIIDQLSALYPDLGIKIVALD